MKSFIISILLLLSGLCHAARVELSWNDNSDNEDGFEIERRIKSEGNEFTVLKTWNVTETIRLGTGRLQWVDVNALPNVTYEYRLRAYNSEGFSGYTNIAEARASGGPKTPTVLNAQPPKILEPDPTTGAMRPAQQLTP